MLRRAWGGGSLSGAQLWLTFAGVTVAGLALMGGGLAEGRCAALAGPRRTPSTRRLMIYRVIAFLGLRRWSPCRAWRSWRTCS